MEKGLLIIGGGILQERTIFCKKLNINIYLVDGNNKCYCKTKVKNFYNIDCFDIKRILQIAKKLKKRIIKFMEFIPKVQILLQLFLIYQKN